MSTSVKIAVQTRSLREPLRRALHTAARLGAEGVEIDARTELVPAELSRTGVRELRKLLGDLNLKVSAVAFPTRRGYDVADDLERRVLATQAAMTFAYELGANVVINRVGAVPDDANDERFGRLVEVLTGLGVYGQRAGARLAAQTGKESGPQLARLIEALPEQSVGVDLHPSGLIHHGHSPKEAVAAVGRYVLHVHACDAVRDLAQGHVLDVELGRGSAELPDLLGQLAEFNYDGWVTIERRDVADPVAEIGNAVAYLRSL
jgi:sugar phosphate isomerase/epimerase